MEWYCIGLTALIALLILLTIGMPLGFAFLFVGAVGIYTFEGVRGLHILPVIFYKMGSSFSLMCLPLFIFIAELITHSGLIEDMVKLLNNIFSRIRGNLAVSTVIGCAGFGAVSGSSLATAATMGSITIPEMIKQKYDKKLASGSVAAGGTLGLLIPPSIVMIVYATITEQSIGKLFMAGVLPGILITVLFSLYILIRTALRPSLAPLPESVAIGWKEKILLTKGIWPIIVLIFAILGTIYLGFATPTESAALGASVLLIIVIGSKRISFARIGKVLRQTIYSSCFIMFLVIGSSVYSHLLTSEMVPQRLSEIILRSEMPSLLIIIGMQSIFFFLGMFLDPTGIILLIMPIYYPILMNLGIDPIWFGIIIMLNVELALITPPVGFNCYIINNIAKSHGISLQDIFLGIVPFAALLIVGIAILMIFPQIVLWLPSRM